MKTKKIEERPGFTCWYWGEANATVDNIRVLKLRDNHWGSKLCAASRIPSCVLGTISSIGGTYTTSFLAVTIKLGSSCPITFGPFLWGIFLFHQSEYVYACILDPNSFSSCLHSPIQGIFQSPLIISHLLHKSFPSSPSDCYYIPQWSHQAYWLSRYHQMSRKLRILNSKSTLRLNELRVPPEELSHSLQKRPPWFRLFRWGWETRYSLQPSTRSRGK